MNTKISQFFGPTNIVVGLISAVVIFGGCGKVNIDDQTVPSQSPGTTAPSPLLAQLKLESLPEVAVDVCAPVALRSFNATGLNVPSTEDVMVNLAPLTAAQYYSDSGCVSSLSSVTLAKNSAYKMLYVKSTQAQSLMLSANYTLSGAILLTSSPLKVNAAPLSGPGVGAFAKVAMMGPDQVSAGSCIPYVLVTTDISGATVNVESLKTFNVAISGVGTFYSDVNCTAPATTVGVLANESNSMFYFKSNSANNTIFIASGGGVVASTLLYVSVKDATEFSPSQLLVDGPRSLTENICSSPFVVKALNAGGVQSAVKALTSINLAGQGTGAFYATPDCSGAPVVSVDIPVGSSSQSFFFKGGSAESLNFTIDDAGPFTATSYAVTVYSSGGSVPVKIAMSGAGSSVAGVCSTAITLKTLDGTNTDSGVSGSTTVNLTGGGTGSFYTASSCVGGTEATSVTFAAGEHTKVVYFKSNTAEALSFNADDPGTLAPAVKPFTVTSGASAKIGFSGPTNVSVGECKAYSVTVLDANDNLTPALVGYGLSLTGGGQFFTDAGCSSAVGSVSIATGQNSSLVFFKASAAGVTSLTVNDGGPLADASLGVTVTNLPPSLLAMSAPASFVAGVCQTFTIQLKNSLGLNADMSGSNLAVTLSDGSSAGTFHAGTSCGGGAITSVSVLDGTSSVQFSYQSTVAESVTFTASSSLPDAVLSRVVAPAAATQLAFSGATTLGVGACSIYTVQVRDALSNPVSQGSSLAIGLSGAGVGSFYSDAGCAVAVSSAVISAGQSQAQFYFKSNAAATLTFAGDDSGALTNASLGVTVSVGLPIKLLVSAASSANVGQCQAVTITAADALNNPSNVAGLTSVSYSGEGSSVFYTANDCLSGALAGTAQIAGGTSSVTVYIKDTSSESLNLSFSASGLGSVSHSWVAMAGAPAQIWVSGPSNVLAGSCAGFMTRTTDSYGNTKSVSGNAILNLTGAGAGAFFADALCTTAIASITIASGNSTKEFYYKSNTASSVVLNADDAGAMTAGTANVTVDALSGTELLLAGDASPAVQACTAYTIYSADALNNVISVGGSPLAVSLLGAGLGGFFSDAGCGSSIASINIPAGQSSVTFYYKSDYSENLTVSLSASGRNTRTKAITVRPLAATQLAMTGTSPVSAGTCASVAIQMRDTLGNPSALSADKTILLGGAGAGAFYGDASCSSSLTSFTFTIGNHSRTVYFKAADALSTTLTVDDSGLPDLTGANFLINVTAAGAASPTRLAINGTSEPAINSCAAYAVITQSSSGASVDVPSNLTVNLTGAGTGSFYSDSSCTSAATAVVVSTGTSVKPFYFKSTNAGSFLFVGSSSGLSVATHAATVASSSGGGSSSGGSSSGGGMGPLTPVKLSLSGAASVLTNACSGPFFVIVRDSNNVEAQLTASATVSLATGSVNATAYSDNSCGTSITTLSFASGESNKQFYMKATQAEGLTMQASHPSLVSASLDVNVLQSALLSVSGGPLGAWQAFYYNGTGALVDQVLTVTNVGQTQATTVGPTGSMTSGFSYKGGGFPGQGGSCSSGMSLAPGAKCTVVVRFQPTSASNFSTTLQLQFDDGVSTRTSTLALAGQGNSNLTVKQVSSGGNHSCFLYSDMTVKCFGNNASGQLGVGSTTNIGQAAMSTDDSQTTPIVSNAVQLVSGDSHNCILNSAGEVFCWGANSYGQLGIGASSNVGHNAATITAPYTKVNLGTGRTAVQVTAGGFHTCALLDNSTIKCWGNNTYGQLGLEDTNNRGTSAGELGDSLAAIQLGSGLTPISVAAGGYHTCALFNSGAVKCWGYNAYGQLGLGDATNRGDLGSTMGGNLATANLGGVKVQSLSLGLYHSCAIVAIPNQINNAVKCWGRNNSGQLGLGDANNRGTSVIQLGGNLSTLPFPSSLNPVAVSAGRTHSCVQMDSGYVLCVGGNGSGQLGGDSTNSINNASAANSVFLSSTSLVSQISVGGNHSCALVQNNTVKCWGDNAYGQLALRAGSSAAPDWGSGTTRPMSQALESKAATFGYPVDVLVNYHSTCIVWKSGDVSCFGGHNSNNYTYALNTKGGMAFSFDQPVSRAFYVDSAQYGSSCFLSGSSTLKCWGDSSNSYFNGPSSSSYYARNPASFTLPNGKIPKKSVSHPYGTCYLTTDNLVYCGGYYEMSSYYPFSSLLTTVVGSTWSGNQYSYNRGAWGQINIANIVDVGASGDYSMCVVISNGDVQCWGRNDNYATGTTSNPTSSPNTVTAAALGANAVEVSMGYGHTCVRLSDGGVKCWGYNGHGQLGNGTTTRNQNPQTISLGTGFVATKIVSSAYSICALSNVGTIKCWGHAGYGALGLGDSNNRGDNGGEMGDSLPTVKLPPGFYATSVYTNNQANHVCATGYLNSNPFLQRVYCWGYNNNYQLGEGSKSTKGTSLSDLEWNLRPIHNTNSQLVDVNATDYRGPGSYTYTVPDGVNQIYIQVWGGGGAGRSYYSGDGNYAGGAGGAGGYSAKLMSVSPGQAFSVGVGGGIRDAYGTSISNVTAGTSSFGSVSAAGGKTGSNSSGAGGVGGAGTGGDLTQTGGTGGTGQNGMGASAYLGGLGGMSDPYPMGGEWPGGGGGANYYDAGRGFTYVGQPGADGRVLVTAVSNFISGSGSSGGAADYTTPGVYIYKIPTGVFSARVQVWGAGGGGGRDNTNGWSTGGGGAGGYSDYIFNVVPGESLYVFVGLGGAGASGSGYVGVEGQQSSVGYNGISVLANGGKPGSTYNTGAEYCDNTNQRCVGGTASGGYLNMKGGNGTANSNPGGTGGAAYLGGLGGVGGTGGGNGQNGAYPGGGGGGGQISTSTNGGAGANGRVIITPL